MSKKGDSFRLLTCPDGNTACDDFQHVQHDVISLNWSQRGMKCWAYKESCRLQAMFRIHLLLVHVFIQSLKTCTFFPILSLSQTAERFEPTNMREWRNYALAALLLLHDERPLRRGWRVEVMEKVGVCLSGEFGRHGMRARNVSSTLVPRGWSGAGCKGKSYRATMLDNVQEVEGEGSRAAGESTQPHS